MQVFCRLNLVENGWDFHGFPPGSAWFGFRLPMDSIDVCQMTRFWRRAGAERGDLFVNVNC